MERSVQDILEEVDREMRSDKEKEKELMSLALGQRPNGWMQELEAGMQKNVNDSESNEIDLKVDLEFEGAHTSLDIEAAADRDLVRSFI